MFPRTSKQMPTPTGPGPREIDSREREGYARKLKKRFRFVPDCLLRRPSFVLLLLPAILLASFYVMVFEEEEYEFEPRYSPAVYRSYNIAEGTLDGYLVWNPRCHMLSKEPIDPSIRAYVKKERFESCADEPPLTGLTREENGTVILYVDPVAVARYPDLECCWSPVFRAEKQSAKNNVDSSIVVKRCRRFQGESALPAEADAAMVSCTAKSKMRGKPIYENVHAILDVNKVSDRFNLSLAPSVPLLSRKLSVLLLGIDSVSRLNFMRSAPNTDKYLLETGWIRFNGYNKMGDNTFPNLMAILTGQNQAQATEVCKPTVPRLLDRCPFVWRNFRQAGYATAYGEDETSLNTFNYLKVGFVEPPTDYYLRPYILACEKLLKVKKRFGLKYCTGPESSFDRILDYAVEFSRAFLGQPYFGLFWTVSVSHENANGLSSMDNRLLGKLRQMEDAGVLNDTMIVLLSDHGMRWGPIRNTLVGWYEERLPFLYIWLPEWFRAERPDAYASVQANRHRLTSPFDLYETLRDVLRLSGGEAVRAPGCPACRSLLDGSLPRERGCADVGISSHWCTCTAFESINSRDPFVQRGATAFLDHVETLLDGYRDKKGRRLCAKLRLKKLHSVNRVIDFTNSTSLAYFYLIQVSPGGGKFEVTMRYHNDNNTFTVTDHDVSRINSYASAAECLNSGMRQYCYCLK